MTRLLRAERLRQKLARPGHDLRRGPAPLRRIAVGLCPPIPRPDAEAEGRARQRPVAGHQHRADRRPAKARARRSAPSPRFTIICASSTPASASPTARLPASPSARRRSDEIIDKILSLPEGTQALSDGPDRTARPGEIRRALGRDSPLRLRAHARRRQIVQRRGTADHRPSPQASVEVVVDRVVVRAQPARPTRRRGGSGPRSGPRRACTSPTSTTTSRSRTGRSSATASTSPAISAAAASSRSIRIISPSTVRSAGARPAKDWACRRAPTRRC